MVLIGLGANLESRFGRPKQTLRAAIGAMVGRGVRLSRLSSWYETAPVPISDQPWYVNAVAEVEGNLPPLALLKVLQDVEEAMGRVRTVRNAARIVDLDILDYDGLVMDVADLQLPHPRLHERAFVLFPICELAPRWRHPTSGQSVQTLIAKLGPDQQIRLSGED